MIAGGAIAGVAVTLQKRHPYDPSRPLIDFDLALMLLPVVLLGVSMGAALPLFPYDAGDTRDAMWGSHPSWVAEDTALRRVWLLECHSVQE